MMVSSIIVGLAAAMALPLALKVGQIAPTFEAEASLSGKPFHFSMTKALNEGSVVVYFYPSAFTPGCNIQARAFALKMDEFKANNASVIGVSMDNMERLNAFSSDPNYCDSKVPVASDPKGEIAALYAVKRAEESKGAKDTRGIEIGHGFFERVTFVVSRDGTIAKVIEGVSAEEHVNMALSEVTRLAKPKK